MNNYTKRKLLKFMTCGSVDDGKSTLIGRLLYDANLLYTDQIKALKIESKTGMSSDELDYSLLLDGLLAEREQKITIDVAYKFFSTKQRHFIVADTPGHEEYTRNMAVGASFADLAVILIDITKGILSQTIRHIKICTLIGIQHFVFAINKMDLVNYNEDRFIIISREIEQLEDILKSSQVQIIPVSATKGDNITTKSKFMQWYEGQTLLKYLETVNIKNESVTEGFFMPIQRVCRPNQNFRGLQGQIEAGEIKVGDEVTIFPSGEYANVKEIYATNKHVTKAVKGQAVTISLNQERDVSRGCVISNSVDYLCVAKLFRATVLWMDEKELIQGRELILKLGNKMVPAVIINLKCKLDIINDKQLAIKTGKKNEIITCDLKLNEAIVCSQFEQQRTMGSFILIDRISNMTSAYGRIEYFLRRESNLKWQKQDITRDMRSDLLGQKPVTLWFTGLSGSGKSTIANAVEKWLHKLGKHTILLDSDNVRMGLNRDLGFEEADRVENIRRFAEVSKLMNDAGLIVLSVLISPFRQDRYKAKKIIGPDCFLEIYISTPLEECEKRDVKGLYRKARLGEISNFTGVDSLYEPPENPDLEINTQKYSIEESVSKILELLF